MPNPLTCHLALIVAHPSSGTRLLGNLLESHPRIRHIFEPSQRVGILLESVKYLRNEMALAKGRGELSVVNLKYAHIDDKLAGWICADCIPVIHLVRQNLSELTASEILRNGGARGKKLRITRKYFESERLRIRRELQKYSAIVNAWPSLLTLYYEEMAGNPAMQVEGLEGKVGKRLLRFLGLEEKNLMTYTIKEHGSLEEKLEIVG